jgi:hypothetical protein
MFLRLIFFIIILRSVTRKDTRREDATFCFNQSTMWPSTARRRVCKRWRRDNEIWSWSALGAKRQRSAILHSSESIDLIASSHRYCCTHAHLHWFRFFNYLIVLVISFIIKSNFNSTAWVQNPNFFYFVHSRFFFIIVNNIFNSFFMP